MKQEGRVRQMITITPYPPKKTKNLNAAQMRLLQVLILHFLVLLLVTVPTATHGIWDLTG
jgi:hypothetical protein